MRLPRFIIGLAAVVVVAGAVAAPALAETYAGVQPYAAEAPLDPGTIVQMSSKSSGKVKVSTKDQRQNMFGVVVNRSQLALTFTGTDLENEAYVATSGTYSVFVSTENGPISSGDFVTLSSIDGVAMKAGNADEQSTVFGRAQASFSGKGVTLGTTKLKDVNGNSNKTVTLGAIPVTIDIKHNPNEVSTKANVPELLQRVGKVIAEKDVSPIRIYLSMAIAGISLIAAIAVLYGGVRSGVISIGRNPVARKSIFRALLQVILTSLLILIIGLFAVYLLLKL